MREGDEFNVLAFFFLPYIFGRTVYEILYTPAQKKTVFFLK